MKGSHFQHALYVGYKKYPNPPQGFQGQYQNTLYADTCV